MIKFKIDVLQELKNKGFSSYRIRREKIFAESTLQRLRAENPSIDLITLDRICKLLELQITDIIEYIPDEDE